jgi:FdhE protein
MQRILDPTQIEAFAERSIPRVRLCDPGSVFGARARRLRALAEGHALGDYLRLMGALAEAQQAAIGSFEGLNRVHVELAHAHRMPLIQASGWERDGRWRSVLKALCTSVAEVSSAFPPAVAAVCQRVRAFSDAAAECQADLLLSVRDEGVDAPAAPFVMAALQVYWTAMASSLTLGDVKQLDVPGVCPVCGTLPVASVVRTDKQFNGYRYLHCALCATEWHMVRIVCTQCGNNEGITYHTIEGGPDAVRAESCGKCHTYRKILYLEKDVDAEPVADDLASIALDLLMTEEGYHRGSGSPLLWQNTGA